MFEGFAIIDMPLGGATIHARTGGSGPPLLLLHGYPQSHAIWHGLAPALAATHCVVAADLRGYGASLAHDGDFTFRAMAADQVALMAELGHDAFHVVAHDRGARTAHRMVLDHPDRVRSVALLDILPTFDVWRLMDDYLALCYYHWGFLAQPGDMPKRLISGDPIGFLHSALEGLSGDLAMFHPDALAAYEAAALNPQVVAAWCGDYRAGATTDREHDRADLGRTSETPCLVLWGEKGVVGHHVNPLDAWRTWFPNVHGRSIDAGHFLAEEREEDVLDAIREHLART